MRIFHLNCGLLHVPPGPKAACHCLLIEANGRLVLIDTGIGLKDIAEPERRIGIDVIADAGFQFHEHLTAVRQIEKLGFSPAAVSDIVLSHGDPDHAGGLADFPTAAVHVAAEEQESIIRGAIRYSAAQFEHGPRWVVHGPASDRWSQLEARRVLRLDTLNLWLVPLFGHTRGHCGVVLENDQRCLFYVGDAYYLRAEISVEDHPVSALAAARADDNALRLRSLSAIRRMVQENADEVLIFGYHDISEFPSGSSID